MRILLLIALTIGVALSAMAQSEIEGRVLDETNNEPIEGATILIIGTDIVSNSDKDGYFSIGNRSGGQVLEVSHMGFTPRTVSLKTDSNDFLALYLSPSEQLLEEVIVSTGYQTLPKERATGAFTVVDQSTFNEFQGTDIMERLPLIANSVTQLPERAYSAEPITIRGLSTIQGPRSPLVIVDDFPYEGDLSSINPNDVQNITILKDAAAASIWGARAGNGVIVITTKKGRFDQRTAVSFSSHIKTQGKPDMFYYDALSSKDFIEMERFLFDQEYRFSDRTNRNRPAFSPVYELLFSEAEGEISSDELERQLSLLEQNDVRKDYRDHIYQDLFNQQYSLQLHGGSENLAWYLSTGYDRNSNQLANKRDRVTVNFNNTYKPFKNLEVSTGVYYTSNSNTGGKTPLNRMSVANRQLPPYTRLVDGEGKAVPQYHFRQPYIDTLAAGALLDWRYYPLTDDGHVDKSLKTNSIRGNINASFRPLSWLDVRANYQIQRDDITNRTVWGEESYFSRDLINRFTEPYGSSGLVRNVPLGSILDLVQSESISQNFRTQINLSNKWTDHEVNGLVGFEMGEISTNSNSNRTYGYDDNNLTNAHVDHVNLYPNLINGGNAFIPNQSYFLGTLHRTVSFFANASYMYKNRYIFSASARRDASNIFGVATNDKWNPLWSTGFSWNLSEEGFYDLEWLPFLKIRSTLGFSGNIDPSKTAVTTLEYFIYSPYTQTTATRIDAFFNPELRWEKVRMINLGVDFRSRSNRISGSIDLFQKKATDLYSPVPIDRTTGLGVNTLTKNAANMTGKGFDVELNTVNIDRIIRWSSKINFSGYNDIITKVYSPYESADYFAGNRDNLVEGYPLNAHFTFKWAGLDPETGNPLGFVNGEKSMDYAAILVDSTKLEDLIYHGSSIPIYHGSLGNQLKWRNVSLGFRINFFLNYSFSKETLDYNNLIRNYQTHQDFNRRWRKPGDEKTTSVPSFVYPVDNRRDNFYRYSEANVIKGDHVRLSQIRLAYSLKKVFLKKIPVKNITLSVSADNLGIIWKVNKEKIDPFYTYGTAPMPKTLVFGLNIDL